MNVIHTSRLQKSADLHGIFYSFSPVLHEWLKTGHKSFTTHQLLPVAFLSAHSLLGGWDQEHSKDSCPSITQQAGTGTECTTFHWVFAYSSSRSGTQNTGRTHAAKSKPSILQGCYFIQNPGELLGATGICPNISA